MFRRRPEARPDPRDRLVEVLVADERVQVPEGASAAAAVLLSSVPAIRTTPVTGAPRLPYCMIGVCFDCLAEIDGVANRQSCLVPVTPGMRIRPQLGPRAAHPGGAA
jgi:D-hydroxyproline dehydrogenase subunit gamma